jgi:hypothetical protein
VSLSYLSFSASGTMQLSQPWVPFTLSASSRPADKKGKCESLIKNQHSTQRQGKARQGKARQGKARQGKARKVCVCT